MGILDRYREIARPDGEVYSIVENLRHILNNKAGFYPILTDFGITDLAATTDRKLAIRRLAEEVLANIRKYEPRLAVDSIQAKGRSPDFWLRMELRGRLNGRPQRLLLLFNQIYMNCDVKVLHVD